MQDDTIVADKIYARMINSTISAAAYGAVGDGIHNDAPAIQAAINALGASGGIVELGIGVYSLGSGLVMPSGQAANAGTIWIQGKGYGTVLKPILNSTFDVISTPIPTVQGAAGFTAIYPRISNLTIDCSLMNATVAGKGNAIHWYGAQYGIIEKVHVISCDNWCILFDGDNTGPGNNFSYDNIVQDCIFDTCNAGIRDVGGEAQNIRNNEFKWAGANCLAAQPVFGTQLQTALHLWLQGGYNRVTGNVFGNGGAYTTPAIILGNVGPTIIHHNRFDQVRNQAIQVLSANQIIQGNAFTSCTTVGGKPCIELQAGSNVITDNVFDNTAATYNWSYAIAETNTGPWANNRIDNNQFLVPGKTGLISTFGTSTPLIGVNGGYNLNADVSPGVPASGTEQQNNKGVPIIVYLVTGGGVVSAIAVGLPGATVATGFALTALAADKCSVVLLPGYSIKLTYAAAAPTWKWFTMV